MLAQSWNGMMDLPFTLASHELNKAEKHYSTTNREAFHNVHKDILYLMKNIDTFERISQCIMLLELDFHTIVEKGKKTYIG